MCVWSQWCSEAQAGGSARHNGGSWPAGRPWALDATPSWRLLQACSSPQPAPPAASAALHPAAFRPSGEGVAAGGGGRSSVPFITTSPVSSCPCRTCWCHPPEEAALPLVDTVFTSPGRQTPRTQVWTWAFQLQEPTGQPVS